jgi:signal transduction histidine kinase
MSGIVDAALGPHQFTREDRYRARLIVITSLTVAASACVLVVLVFALDWGPKFIPSAAGGGALVVVNLWMLRRTGWLELTAMILCLGLLAAVIAACWVAGGLAQPVLPWTLLVPLYAPLLLRPRLAMVCVALVIANIGSLYVAEASGYQFPPIPGRLGALVSDQIVLTLLVAALVWMYERARRDALVERDTALAALREAQKLESVGRLASGVAHEINTPVQFVNDSIHFVRDAVGELFGVIEKLAAEAANKAAEITEAADLPFLLDKVPNALERAIEGLGRITTIVRSMKDFAHPDQKEMSTVDLNRAVESTLTIARNEYKYVADLETDFGELPSVRCYVGELNQAVLNIVVNAAHAIGDVVQGTDARGVIRVRTRVDGDQVVIAIADSGGGIPDATRDRIFEPFFTTKEIGKGTGQGLALARSVIVDRHHGQLSLETELGKGTTFFIRVPINDLLTVPATKAAA